MNSSATVSLTEQKFYDGVMVLFFLFLLIIPILMIVGFFDGFVPFAGLVLAIPFLLGAGFFFIRSLVDFPWGGGATRGLVTALLAWYPLGLLGSALTFASNPDLTWHSDTFLGLAFAALGPVALWASVMAEVLGDSF